MAVVSDNFDSPFKIHLLHTFEMFNAFANTLRAFCFGTEQISKQKEYYKTQKKFIEVHIFVSTAIWVHGRFFQGPSEALDQGQCALVTLQSP